jgi:hypothetical protein
MPRLATLALAALVAVVALTAAMPAAAKSDKEVRRVGSCSGSAGWKLELDFDDGRIGAEFEVDQNRNGERWRVALKRNGHRFFRGIRTTRAPSGSFEVDRKVRNHAGRDRIKARALNLRTGEVCRAAATI